MAANLQFPTYFRQLPTIKKNIRGQNFLGLPAMRNRNIFLIYLNIISKDLVSKSLSSLQGGEDLKIEGKAEEENLSKVELFSLKTLRSRNDVVIKPAGKLKVAPLLSEKNV